MISRTSSPHPGVEENVRRRITRGVVRLGPIFCSAAAVQHTQIYACTRLREWTHALSGVSSQLVEADANRRTSVLEIPIYPGRRARQRKAILQGLFPVRTHRCSHTHLTPYSMARQLLPASRPNIRSHSSQDHNSSQKRKRAAVAVAGIYGENCMLRRSYKTL